MIELGGIVTGFHVTEHCIDCLCEKDLLKIDKNLGNIICRKTVFEKEGLSRKLIADDERIYIYDFCTLYIWNQMNYELLGKWRLGHDVSSDICGIAVDDTTVYCSIRNGKIITLNKQSYQTKEFSVSGSSMWSIKNYNQYLAAGTVGGELLLLDKSTLSIERNLILGRKNIGSLHINGGTLYAAGHDGKLFKISIESFKAEASAKRAHKKMFDCAGTCGDMLVTVSHPCSEISLWNKETLQKIRVISTPLKLTGCTYIEEGFMYISSRNIPGIERISIQPPK